MHQGKLKIILFQILLVAFLASCTPPSSPVLASWSEQYTAARGIVKGLGNEFVLIDAVARPIRSEGGAPDGSIELKVILVFESREPIAVNGDPPGYVMQDVDYNDHRLTATLTADEVGPRMDPPPSAALDRASMLQIGPQDALQLTVKKGEAYMGEPVNHGNIDIQIVWDVSEDQPELKNVLAPAWRLTYYRKNSQLYILINAQTGEILKRYESSD